MAYVTINPAEITTATNCKGPVFAIPRDQAYFWTEEWQAGERESAAEIEAGNTRVFDSDDPSDVTRWLLSEDDD